MSRVVFCRRGPSSAQGLVCQETRDSLGDAAENLADLWATRADILMNLGGLKRASKVPCQEALSISPYIYICIYTHKYGGFPEIGVPLNNLFKWDFYDFPL